MRPYLAYKSHLALDAHETGEVAVGVQFLGAQPGANGVIDFPEFDEGEAQGLMDERIHHAISHFRLFV